MSSGCKVSMIIEENNQYKLGGQKFKTVDYCLQYGTFFTKKKVLHLITKTERGLFGLVNNHLFAYCMKRLVLHTRVTFVNRIDSINQKSVCNCANRPKDVKLLHKISLEWNF